MGHQPVGIGPNALGELILAERRRRSLARRELAELMRRADRTLRTNEKAVARWERGHTPQPAALRALAAVLGQPVERLAAAAKGQNDAGGQHIGFLDLPPSERADQDYVVAVHEAIQHLVSLESRCGSDELAPLAVRLLRTVQRRTDQGAYERGVERDLMAATGELAELAGWQLYDADRREAARQMNREALFLTRLANDRSTELLTLANMSYMEARDGRPGCALQIARSALGAGRLSARLHTIFGIREGRALAKLGNRDSALRVLDQARTGFFDGPGVGDPDWAWWIDEAQVLAHMGRAHADLGYLDQAMHLLSRAAEQGLTPAVRFDYLAHLFEAATIAGAWADGTSALEMALPYVGEIGSGRIAGVLRRGIQRVVARPAPPHLVDAAHHLGSALTAAGYSEQPSGPPILGGT